MHRLATVLTWLVAALVMSCLRHDPPPRAACVTKHGKHRTVRAQCVSEHFEDVARAGVAASTEGEKCAAEDDGKTVSGCVPVSRISAVLAIGAFFAAAVLLCVGSGQCVRAWPWRRRTPVGATARQRAVELA